MKKNLLVISQVPPPFHGSTVMTQVFLETLDSLGFSFRLVDRRFSKSLSSVGRFNLSKVASSIGLTIRLISGIVSVRPQHVIFFMTNRTASFLVDVLLSEILRLSKVPVIGYIHTQGFEALAKKGKLWESLVRRLLGSAETLVCLSPSLEADVRRLAPKATLTSIGNTPFAAPMSVAVEKPDAKAVLFLSNFIAEKGIDQFLDLGHKFAAAGSALRFVAAGAPTDDEQLAQLRESASWNTEIVGAVHGDSKWHLLGESSVLVFPSRYPFEAQPLVIVEAMSVGLPVVAYAIGGVGDLVIDGETGLLLPQGDAEGFEAALKSLDESPGTVESMGIAARDRYNSNHSRASYERAWNDILAD